ncbi:MAG: DUF1287 domain-containing protein [Arenimonas sp.]
MTNLSRLALLVLLCAWQSSAAAAMSGAELVARAASAQVGVTLSYDPGYSRIAYPGGDVPSDRGVCTDVVVRAFRAVGIDLQALVHEDMQAHFREYPHKWRLSRPDANIDHRRVPNLQAYFSRQKRALPVSANAADYAAGDVVSWRLPGGLDHVGVVTAQRIGEGADSRPMVVHNIGQGAREEDVLFAWPQTGHYRWFAANPGVRK